MLAVKDLSEIVHSRGRGHECFSQALRLILRLALEKKGALPEPGVATSGPQGLLKSAHGKTALYCHEGIES